MAAHVIDEQLSVANPGFVTVTALLELDWTLRTRYGFSQSHVRAVLSEMITEPKLVVERAREVTLALSSTVAGLADNMLHEIAKAYGSSKTVTFDRKFAKLEGVELIVTENVS